MSFRRRDGASGTSSKHSTLRNPSYHTTSTGIPSLDDILGDGLPLGTILLVLGTDLHTKYPDLVHRYFIAEGLASGHNVTIVDENAEEIVSNCMWMQTTGTTIENEDEVEPSPSLSPGVKIAWRYEKMKPFQTSVSHNSCSTRSNHPFELVTRIPDSVIGEALTSERLHYLRVKEDWDDKLFHSIESNFSKIINRPNAILRLSIPLLGSPDWGDLSPSDLLRFLHRLRALMRRNPTVASHVCACISLPAHLTEEKFGGVGWIGKLAWLSDGCIRLQSFAADPSLAAMFPGQHGLVHIENLPVPFSLVPPSDRLSELRGLSNYSSSDTGGGENNLAFKCTRKRFLIETLHLDVEGGVSERRTTVPMTGNGTISKPSNDTALSSVPIIREEADVSIAPPEIAVGKKGKKVKKKVNFQSDRPDIFDF